MKWNKVEDCLPEYEVSVLMVVKHFSEPTENPCGYGSSKIVTGQRSFTVKKGDIFKSDDSYTYTTYPELRVITHWMEFPKLP